MATSADAAGDPCIHTPGAEGSAENQPLLPPQVHDLAHDRRRRHGGELSRALWFDEPRSPVPQPLDAANVAPSAAGTCWVVDRRSPMVADSPLPRSKIGARVRFAAANGSNWQPWKGHARLRPFRTTRHSTPRGLSPQTVPVHGMARRVPTSLSSRSRTTAATGSRGVNAPCANSLNGASWFAQRSDRGLARARSL